MHTHNVLYRGWTIVMLVTLLLPTASLPGTATLTVPVGWEEVRTGSASGGGISNNSGSSFYPSVAVAPDGTYVAWSNYWSALGSGMDGSVYALVVDGSGNLYAGGWFTTAGGVSANHVARWNGSSWSALGSEMDRSVYALAVDGSGNLYAGGYFTTAGGASANYVARWNRSNWSALGSGMNGSVYALVVDGGNLYAGGDFTTAGGASANYVAQWWGPPVSPLVMLPIIMKGYCDCGPDNYEPNGSCGQAYGPLTSGQTYQSWISCCDVATHKKSDYFYIDISTTNAINIYLTNIPPSTDYDLYLYSDCSQDPCCPVAKSTNYGNSPETIPYSPPATGRYYIRVYAYSGYSTSPYSLRVTYD